MECDEFASIAPSERRRLALKKSQLYSSLWQSCDELRGGMDASQYKDYILTLLFVKYVSDKWAGKSDALIEIPKGGSFADMVRLKGDKDIGEKIDKIIQKLADANDLRNVIDIASFNDDEKLGKGKEMVDRLSKLIGIFETLDFRANRADGDDLLGDAYEYLMRHFATESGKSKGQFYTPAEVSRIMAKVIGIGPKTRQDQTIYDPTCGSGSLLLKAADESPKGLSIYGQENDVATWALARMNMILHGHATADIRRQNTLSTPLFKDPKTGKLQTFDFAVANPPFSAKAWTNGLDPDHDEFGRFEYGVPPAKNGDYAFLLHLLKSLKQNGRGAIIMPHGVLFRGNKEADIRRNLLKQGFIKGIIGLPPNLFYGTGIPACIIVLDKENAASRKGIFMIDASRGYVKDGSKNRLRDQDIHKIVDVFTKQTELAGYSRTVPLSEIASPANDYNLNIPRYIVSREPEDLHDLDAHLRGGIPNRDLDALDAYWKVFPTLRAQLFETGDRPGYSRANVEAHQVKATILAHPEFKAYSAKAAAIFDGWAKAHTPLLKSMKVGSKPKEIIAAISEDLLARFANVPLLDKYDAYQRLMDYWNETMQDDVYLIAAEGWLDAAKPRAVIEDKERKLKETPDLVVDGKKYKMDLLPPALIIARYFAKEREVLDALEAKRADAARELEEFIEENSGDDGFLEDAKNEKGTITKASVKARLAALGKEPQSDEEETALTHCLRLIEAEANASREVGNTQKQLDSQVLAQYAKLNEADAKEIAVANKWLASVRMATDGNLLATIGMLTTRLEVLEERYAETNLGLTEKAARFESLVANHFNRMGL